MPVQPTRNSLMSSAPTQGKQGGLVRGLWVFQLPSLNPAEKNAKAEFAVAPSLFPYLLFFPIPAALLAGAGNTCLGSPCQAWAILSRNFGQSFGPGASHLWANSHCFSLSQARRLKAGSASGFQLLPLHCNLPRGAILQMLEETTAIFLKD